MTTQIVIAHRGASAYAPENTLPSYDLAVLQGADCIEIDLHPSRDNVLVCIHDSTLERTTNVRCSRAPMLRSVQAANGLLTSRAAPAASAPRNRASMAGPTSSRERTRRDSA